MSVQILGPQIRKCAAPSFSGTDGLLGMPPSPGGETEGRLHSMDLIQDSQLTGGAPRLTQQLTAEHDPGAEPFPGEQHREGTGRRTPVIERCSTLL